VPRVTQVSMTPRGKVDNSVLVNRNLGATLHTLFLLGETTKEFLDLGDGQSRVEAFGAGLCAVHDGVTSVDGKFIVPQLIHAFSSLVVATVDNPTISLHQNSWSKIFIWVPPVGRTRGGATGAEDALVEAVQLGPVLLRLQQLVLAGPQLVLVVPL